jgi:hypothetical protein
MSVAASSPEGRRLLEACELHEIGFEMRRQKLRREHPDATAAMIDDMMAAWVSDRPYDSPGSPVSFPRR